MTEEERRRHINAWIDRVGDHLHAGSVEELHGLSEQELIWRHDEVADAANRVPGSMTKTPYLDRAQVYAAELARREAVRQGQRMEALTESLNRLTWVITVATIIGVCLTAASLLFG